jgi:hypothetical protein
MDTTMKLTTALAFALALAAGCDRHTTTPPSPKADSGSALPQAAAGASTTPANAGTPSAAERRDGANPVQGQVDPKQAEQHRDFRQDGDQAGPQSRDTKPTMQN